MNMSSTHCGKVNQHFQINHKKAVQIMCCMQVKVKGKAVPLQAWSGREGSRKLRFPDYVTMAQDGGKVVSLMHRPIFMLLVLISVRG
jgi:hypothetical protein